MSKSMADVLAEHQIENGHRDLNQHCTCGWKASAKAQEFIGHQAGAIAAEGYGDLKPIRDVAAGWAETSERYKREAEAKRAAGFPRAAAFRDRLSVSFLKFSSALGRALPEDLRRQGEG